MSYKTIEEYFTQFPDDVETINVTFVSEHLPDLSRFYKLKNLSCYNNKLVCLPLLPSTLEILWCSNNKLTYLPELPSMLIRLECYNNELTYLPLLPPSLETLMCYNNRLTHLPLLPSTLEYLYCINNQFLDYYIKHDDNMSMTDYITKLRNQIEIINKFRELFYTLKYKKQFQYLLWERIREPKIRNKYHPSNLMAMLEEKEDITLDELDELLEKW